MKNFVQTSLILLAVTGVSAGCVSNSDVDILERRVQEQDMRLRQMQPAQADSWAQVQELQQEVNRLKGQMDELQRAGGAGQIVSTLQRHDAALHQIQTSLAINLNLDPQSAAPAPDGQQPAQLQPGQPGLAGQPEGTPQQGAAAAAAALNNATTPPPAAPQQPAAKDTATALYDAGLSAFTARQYKQAQRSFSDFTRTYKNHARIADAYYYIAECYFQQNQFADAALAYDTVITKYGKTTKAAPSYLKQGISFSKLGQNAAAKARMQELIKRYPTSAEAARAKTFLKTNK